MNTSARPLPSAAPGRPLVSVVTPSYQTAPFIGATIESVRTQSYPHIEHLVMDGGSTDGTVDILNGYPHLQWVSEKDRGQSDALNKGFRRVQGEVIGWLNSDDTYTPHAVARAVRYLHEHPETDAVYGDVAIIDEQGATIGASLGEPFDAVTLLTRNMVKQPALFMRRRMLEQLGGVDEALHFVMDQELWLRAAVAGFRIDYLPEWLANFRICSGTKTFTSAGAFHREWGQVLERMLAHPFFAHLPERERRAIIAANRTKPHLGAMMEAMAAGRRQALVVHAARAIRQQPSLSLKPSMWGLIALGVLGRPRGRNARYNRGIEALTLPVDGPTDDSSARSSVEGRG